MKIKYKVVTTNRRSIVTSKFDKYSLEYFKGNIVFSKKDTIGIFCFKTKEDAVTYMEKDFNPLLDDDYLIIKVLPLQKGVIPKYVADAHTQNCIEEFYNNGMFKTFPQKGTICYPKILVIE